MTDDEGRAWCAGLGKTPAEQARAIRELLRHARADGMSGEDVTICQQQLARIEDALRGWRRRWK